MQIGTMTTGAGVVTTIKLDNGIPQVILVGTTDTDLPLQAISLSISGASYIDVTTQALIQAMSKYMNESLLGADVKVAQALLLANGFIAGKNGVLKLTNAGVTTPAVYAASYSRGNEPVSAGQAVVNDNSYQMFSGFEAIIFDPTNLSRADIVFADGHKDSFSAPELAALFARSNQADADGYLAGMCVIDNQYGNIAEASVFASGGDITVLQLA